MYTIDIVSRGLSQSRQRWSVNLHLLGEIELFTVGEVCLGMTWQACPGLTGSYLIVTLSGPGRYRQGAFVAQLADLRADLAARGYVVRDWDTGPAELRPSLDSACAMAAQGMTVALFPAWPQPSVPGWQQAAERRARALRILEVEDVAERYGCTVVIVHGLVCLRRAA
jgi:hypothetical protein